MIGIIGKKIGMTQLFTEDGGLVPVTVVQAGPCWVTQKKEIAKDGYNAVQIGFQAVKERKLPKPELGHLKKKALPPLKHLREIRGMNPSQFDIGQEIKVNLFNTGDVVDVIGTSKGKGFAGVIKRHHYRGGADTHGSMFHRAPGSIGASSFPSRVTKGRRLPGHMGAGQKTLESLTIMRVDTDKNLLLIKGAVPGGNNGLLVIIGEPAQKTA